MFASRIRTTRSLSSSKAHSLSSIRNNQSLVTTDSQTKKMNLATRQLRSLLSQSNLKPKYTSHGLEQTVITLRISLKRKKCHKMNRGHLITRLKRKKVISFGPKTLLHKLKVPLQVREKESKAMLSQVCHQLKETVAKITVAREVKSKISRVNVTDSRQEVGKSKPEGELNLKNFWKQRERSKEALIMERSSRAFSE